jgi:ubiquinone/menaquinone biosynthesis C-methylase UbiE
MEQYGFKQPDFENPSLLFKIEELLKGILGGPLLYDRYYKSFGLKGNETVLDFGCGGGTGSRSLAGLLNTGQVICLDSSSYFINKARKRLSKYSNTECIHGTIAEADIPVTSIDVVSIIHVIHDIAPSERQRTVNSLSDKLKPGGFLFIREPIRESHGMPIAEIRELLTAAGLKETGSQSSKTEFTGSYIKPDHNPAKATSNSI